jgi:uncharacterized membrane protein
VVEVIPGVVAVVVGGFTEVVAVVVEDITEVVAVVVESFTEVVAVVCGGHYRSGSGGGVGS